MTGFRFLVLGLASLIFAALSSPAWCQTAATQSSAPDAAAPSDAPVPVEAPGEAPAKGKASQKGDKDDTGSTSRFLRIDRDPRQEPIALVTSVTRFVGKNAEGKPVQVDLVGAVHVAEGAYYDQLNKLFDEYDAVLYELVAPEGTRVTPGEKRGNSHPVSMLQKVMKNVLNLEFQLDKIDYTKANMVHADMSLQEFSQTMQDRGESFLKMFLQMMGQAMASQSPQKNMPSDLEMLVALVAKDRANRLKRIMAEQFENMEGQLSAIGGPDGSTIITERNKKALSVLRNQLGKGKQRLAIFYGAGHLSDMAQRLETEFGLRQESQRWLVAWTIVPPPPPADQGGDVKQESTQ